jgi:hypothetical protein
MALIRNSLQRDKPGGPSVTVFHPKVRHYSTKVPYGAQAKENKRLSTLNMALARLPCPLQYLKELLQLLQIQLLGAPLRLFKASQ